MESIRGIRFIEELFHLHGDDSDAELLIGSHDALTASVDDQDETTIKMILNRANPVEMSAGNRVSAKILRQRADDIAGLFILTHFNPAEEFPVPFQIQSITLFEIDIKNVRE